MYSECYKPCSFCHVNILIQNVFQVFCVFYLYITFRCDWITTMGYNKHELGSINVLYSAPPKKKIVVLHPTSPSRPPLHNDLFLLSPWWPWWRGSTVVFTCIACFPSPVFHLLKVFLVLSQNRTNFQSSIVFKQIVLFYLHLTLCSVSFVRINR